MTSVPQFYKQAYGLVLIDSDGERLRIMQNGHFKLEEGADHHSLREFNLIPIAEFGNQKALRYLNARLRGVATLRQDRYPADPQNWYATKKENLDRLDMLPDLVDLLETLIKTNAHPLWRQYHTLLLEEARRRVVEVLAAIKGKSVEVEAAWFHKFMTTPPKVRTLIAAE